MNAQQFPGMSHPWPLRVTRAGDGRAVAVHVGPILLSAFRAGENEMRDLTICALTEGSRFQGKTVAAAFGIHPSRCRGSAPATVSTAPGDWSTRWAARRCSALPGCGRPAPGLARVSDDHGFLIASPLVRWHIEAGSSL